jgi:PAS domain S-box-containing protein
MPTNHLEKNASAVNPEIALLKGAFEQFEANSKRLEQAYFKMQADFKKLNLELDAKNEELKSTLEETRTMRERLNCILESIKSGVVVVDEQGRITHFNRAAEITGFKAGEMVGKFCDKGPSYHTDSRGLLHTLKTREEIHNEERDLKTKNGVPIPVNYNISLVKDDREKILGAVEVFHDISDIKAMELEVQQARTLAALGEMSATVAHEIRNPLGGIGTYAALLERDLERNDPRRKLVQNMMQGLASLNKIVTNLLVYTRPMRGEFRRVSLSEIVDEITDFALLEIESQYKTGIKINKRFSARSAFSRIEPEKIQQLLLNLFFNAAQAMPKGGTITVSLRQVEKTPVLSKKNSEKKWNCIGIEDQGNGISPENIEKIFSPFFTTKENGTGLGLAIVRKIAEFHKGHIHTKSKVGKGTLFELYLPSVV